MSECGKNGGHCCWIDGKVCAFLRDDGPEAERQFVCTLRESLDSWERVYQDGGWIAQVKPFYVRTDQPFCGDWPGPGTTCAECGQRG